MLGNKAGDGSPFQVVEALRDQLVFAAHILVTQQHQLTGEHQVMLGLFLCLEFQIYH